MLTRWGGEHIGLRETDIFPFYYVISLAAPILIEMGRGIDFLRYWRLFHDFKGCQSIWMNKYSPLSY